MSSATHRLGRLVWCVHHDGVWVRGDRGVGSGWCINGPRLRPLFSERMGKGERVLLRCRGWRLKRLAAWKLAEPKGRDQ